MSPAEHLNRHKQPKLLPEMDGDAIKLTIAENGFAVVENVLTADECKHCLEKSWDWLEALGTGIRRNDPATWSDSAWPPNKFGIFTNLSGHQDFIWEVRKHPNVLKVFGEIWGDKDLLVSFDGMSIRRPGLWGQGVGQLHRDQHPHRTGFECVQGLLNLTEITTDHASIVVRKGSHKFDSRDFSSAAKYANKDSEFFALTPDDIKQVEDFEEVRLTGAAGSMFLWDSRILHQGVPALSPDVWRYAVYLCYQPRALASKEDLSAKRKAYKEYVQTSHWPIKTRPTKKRPDPRFADLKTRDAVEDSVVLRLSGF